MRECLGWITNCPNDGSCPQNWLELSVSEIPTKVHCHVCEQPVDLIAEEAEFETRARRDELVAFPVVPCTGMAAAPRAAPSATPAPREPSPPPREPSRPKQRAPQVTWFVTLSNGESIAVDKDNMVLGRSRACDIVIPSAKVSRQHASLSLQNGVLFIEDLGSANGVWINGEKITRSKVSGGDTYTISDETLVFDAR